MGIGARELNWDGEDGAHVDQCYKRCNVRREDMFTEMLLVLGPPPDHVSITEYINWQDDGHKLIVERWRLTGAYSRWLIMNDYRMWLEGKAR